jgi:hypothetical protein
VFGKNAKLKGELLATRNSMSGFDTWLTRANLKHSETFQIGGSAKSAQNTSSKTQNSRVKRLLRYRRLDELGSSQGGIAQRIPPLLRANTWRKVFARKCASLLRRTLSAS